MRTLALSTVLLVSAFSAGAQTLTGLWSGTIQYDDYKIPFPIEFKQTGTSLSAAFFNGDQRVSSTSGTITGTSLTVNFDHYATRLTATVSDGIIKGTYGNPQRGFHQFEATRQAPEKPAARNAPNIAGVWDLPNESPKGEHAWRLIITQHGAEASAAILRVDGDTGALTGTYRDGKFVLNHFDGARAAVMEITPGPDGSLDVALKGFHNPTKHFTAYRIDEAKAKGLPQPTDPDEHTRVKDANEPFRFSFPDLNGKTVSNTDGQFRDKVVLVNITGSWCPNCHDEAPFLADLYREYHARGLEIVALDFEEPEQQKDLTRLRSFIQKYGIEYTYLLAGEPAEVQAKIPQALNLNSWPTTFFLGRDGRVRAIHAGFAAPASGNYNVELKKEVRKTVEQLLAEDIRASR